MSYLNFRSLSLFHHRELEILVLSMQVFLLLANIMVPFNVVSKKKIYYHGDVGRIAEETCQEEIEM